MSVQKPSDEYEEEYKEPVRGTQWFVISIIKFLLQISIFFLTLWVVLQFYDITADNVEYFIFTCINYIASGFFAFFGSYAIFSSLCNLTKYKPNPIQPFIRKLRKLKHFCVYVFVILIQSLFFVLSINANIIEYLPFDMFWSYVFTWIIIAILSRVIGRGLYYILSRFKFQI